MAVIEPLRKSPSSRNRVRIMERCWSRAARDSGKRHLQLLTYTYVRIIPVKKENFQILPCVSHTRGAAAAPTPARAPPTTAAAPRQRSDRRHASTQNVVQTLANRPLKTNGFPAEYAPKCESWASRPLIR